MSALCSGKQLALVKTSSAVRTCGFDFGGNIIMFSTDKQMGYQCFVSFFDLRDPSQIGEGAGPVPAPGKMGGALVAGATVSVCLSPSFLPAENNEPYMKIPCSDSKITSAVWGPLGEFIIAGHESGELNQFSAKVSLVGSSLSLGGYRSVPRVVLGQNRGFLAQTSSLMALVFTGGVARAPASPAGALNLPLFPAVRGAAGKHQGAHQADQRHPDLQGHDHVHHCLQGQHGQGEGLQEVTEARSQDGGVWVTVSDCRANSCPAEAQQPGLGE